MLKTKWGRVLWRIAKILGAVYLGLLLYVFFAQRSFIYFPTKNGGDGPVQFARTAGFEPWTNGNGAFIGWKRIDSSNGPHERLIIIHGNGGCAMDRLDYADELRTILPLDVYLLEFPGYGAREGTPSQKSLFAAADEALNLLKKEGGVYIVGESLGTGVACYLAGTHPQSVKGVLLIAPYNTLTDVAQVHMPIFPVRLMLWDRFPSSSFLKNYHGPIAMLFAGRDTVVPNRFGHKLYDGYQGPKKFWEMPLAGHGGLLRQTDVWWRELVAFWKTNASQVASPGQPQ
jgi:uncharacterized protein